jgi:hypothetical protein
MNEPLSHSARAPGFSHSDALLRPTQTESLPTMNSSPDTPSGDLRRLPGLYRRWDLTEVLEQHPNCQIEDAGNHADGTPLVAVFSSEPAALSTDRLVQMPVGELAALPACELLRLQREVDETLRKAKLTAAWLDGALSVRYSARAHQARAADLKDTGTIRFDDNGITVVADLPKRIEWDQDALSGVVELLTVEGEDPRHYVEITFKVSERRYAAWPPHIRRVFEPARTVRTGKETFQLIAGDA